MIIERSKLHSQYISDGVTCWINILYDKKKLDFLFIARHDDDDILRSKTDSFAGNKLPFAFYYSQLWCHYPPVGWHGRRMKNSVEAWKEANWFFDYILMPYLCCHCRKRFFCASFCALWWMDAKHNLLLHAFDSCWCEILRWAIYANECGISTLAKGFIMIKGWRLRSFCFAI